MVNGKRQGTWRSWRGEAPSANVAANRHAKPTALRSLFSTLAIPVGDFHNTFMRRGSDALRGYSKHFHHPIARGPRAGQLCRADDVVRQRTSSGQEPGFDTHNRNNRDELNNIVPLRRRV